MGRLPACVDTLLYCLHHGAIYDNHSERQNNPCGIELRSCNPYAADMYNLWRKEIRDMIDWTAAADGIPPWYLRLRAFHYKGAEVPWGQYYVMAPWLTYLYYGDNDLLAEAYPLVKRYLEFWLEEDRYLKCDRPNDGDTAAYAASCDVNNGRIDWAETTNPELGSSGLMFDMLKTAARMARLFGKPDDASSFDAEAAVIAERLNRKYYDPVNKVYQCPKMYPPDYAWLKETERIGEGKIRPTQGGSALALTAGFAPEKDRTFIAAGIVRDMNENWNGHYSTGDMLSWRLPMALGDNGQPEAAYGILARKEYPGLGHCLSPGLNTICENLNTWNGPSGLDAFCQVNRLGLSNWLYEGLCGIRPDPEQPGFKHIILKPYVPPNLDSAGLHFASDYGEIVSAWQKQNGMLIYSITVPPNTTATVTIPAPSADAVTESGVRAEQSKGVSLIRTEAGSVVYAVQAGSYRFAVAFRVFPNLEGVPE
jgi:alpha-L-rhamnosidase